jgi:hypothetical protein
MKHLELFKQGFDSTLADKVKVENWPYIGYDVINNTVAYSTIVEKEEPLVPGFVDLGLSVMWAECNLGASSPEQTGYFYSFGEVEGHEKNPLNLDLKDGHVFSKTSSIYINDTEDIQGTEYDAVKYFYRDRDLTYTKYFMPNASQITELL